MGKLIDIVKGIYHKTPGKFQFIYSPLKFVDKHIDKLRYDVWILSGEETLSRQNMCIIYAYNGRSKENMNLLTNMALGQVYTERFAGKLWRWQIDETVKEKGRDCSLMILEAPKDSRILSEKNCFYIPGWLYGEVDISDEALLFKNSSLKSDVRRIRKNNLHFEIRNEVIYLDDFYHNMYVPYITKAHNSRAIIMDYDYLLSEFKKCDLLFIKKDQLYIAGCLISYREDKPRLWSLGVRNADSAYINEGAIGAVFYYSVQHLRGQGHRSLNFGLSRPFMNDGVLRYKKKWGLKIVSADKSGFMIKTLPRSGGIKGFLMNNPFVFQDEGNFKGAIFVNNEQSLTEKDFKRIYKDYYLAGITCLNIYFDGVVNDDLRDSVPFELRDKLRILPVEGFLKGREESVQ